MPGWVGDTADVFSIVGFILVLVGFVDLWRRLRNTEIRRLEAELERLDPDREQQEFEIQRRVGAARGAEEHVKNYFAPGDIPQALATSLAMHIWALEREGHPLAMGTETRRMDLQQRMDELRRSRWRSLWAAVRRPWRHEREG